MPSFGDKIHRTTLLQSIIISNNSTSSAGADKEIHAFMDESDKAKFKNYLAKKKLVWKYKFPEAPHFCGVCERLDQISKKIMIAVWDDRHFEDELLTMSCQQGVL